MVEQRLTLVGLSEDKQRLVLVDDAGQQFTLAVDARLRAALRGEHTSLGQLEITMDSALRPRDIQARIRSGETPEQVAAAAQTTIDKVMAFATPVLAERAHVADRAQRASVRRLAGEGPSRVLGDAVAERLHARGVDPESVEWDAWRRGDGRWTLVADYRSGEQPRHAEFAFDTGGRYVVAEDDEARWLVGEQQSTSRGPQPRGATGPRRLSAVGNDDALPLGEDALEMVAEPDDETHVPTHSVERPAGPAGQPEEQQEQEQEQQPQPAEAPPVSTDADWIATQASERPARDPLADEERSELGSEADDQAASERPDATAAEQDVEEPEEPTARRAAKKGRRPSVPSWDEIMFGGGSGGRD